MAKRTEVVRLVNSSNQTLSIQVCPPGGDFYRHEQQVRLLPGSKPVLLPKDHLKMSQINNLRSKRMLQVVYDSEA